MSDSEAFYDSESEEEVLELDKLTIYIAKMEKFEEYLQTLVEPEGEGDEYYDEEEGEEGEEEQEGEEGEGDQE